MKTVLITGAGRGLGKCLTEVFKAGGYNVLSYRGKIDGDLRNSNTIAEIKDSAEIWDIDILINNAGVYINESFSNMTTDGFEEVIDTNLLAPINLTKAVWPVFQRKKSGTVVFINSVAGRQGSSNETAYCASKFGLKGFADSLRYDGVRDGVRIISVFLGAMETDMIKDRKGNPKHNIDPYNAAQIILNLCKDYTRAEVTEITIDKTGNITNDD